MELVKYMEILGIEVMEREKYTEEEALYTYMLNFYGMWGITLGPRG